MKLKSIARFFRKRCPRCSSGRLHMKNAIRATCVGDGSERYPNFWTYYECDQCKTRLKIYLSGKVEEPTDEEWARDCQKQNIV